MLLGPEGLREEPMVTERLIFLAEARAVRPGAGIRSPNEARISHRYGPTGPGDDTYNLNHPRTGDTKRDIARQSGTATAGRRDGTVPQTKTISGSYRDTPNPNGARNGAYSGTGDGESGPTGRIVPPKKRDTDVTL